MQFRVPQFIDVEDKIFGPFTFRQFVYLAGGAGAGYVLYRLLPSIIGIPLALAMIGFALALTFYKINDKPFIFIVEAWFKYAFQSKLYIWKQRIIEKKAVIKTEKTEEKKEQKFSESKLRDVAWSLDVLDK